MPRNHNRTGRSKNSPKFVMLLHHTMNTHAYRSLSTAARSVLLEVAAVFNGHNNGDIGLSCRDAGARAGVSKNTAQKALRELEQKGFIDVVQRGHFDWKKRHASTYRLTWFPCDIKKEKASHRYKNWKPVTFEGQTVPEGVTDE